MRFRLFPPLRGPGLWSLSLLTLGMTVLHAAPIRILPFGESTTDGGGTESYRKKLGDQLTAHGIAYDFIGSLKRPNPASWDADHQGMSGKANIDLNNWMNVHGASYQADIVLLWQGTNDVAWGWHYYGAPLDSLSALIDRICEKQPNAQVFVSSIPMMGPDAYPDARGPGEANAATTAYNNAMPALISAKQAQGKKVHFVDTRGVLQVSDLMGDGIHPTQAGYDKMVPHWFAAIQPFLTPGDAPPTATGTRSFLRLRVTPEK